VIDGMNIHNSEIEINPHMHPVILLAGTAELKWDAVEDIFRKKMNLPNSADKNIRFCSHCGAAINKDAVICVKCGCVVSDSKGRKIKEQGIKTTSGGKKRRYSFLILLVLIGSVDSLQGILEQEF
jgi:hypothetical protein